MIWPFFYAWYRDSLYFLSRDPADITARRADTFDSEKELMARFAKLNKRGRYSLVWENRGPKADDVWRD